MSFVLDCVKPKGSSTSNWVKNWKVWGLWQLWTSLVFISEILKSCSWPSMLTIWSWWHEMKLGSKMSRVDYYKTLRLKILVLQDEGKLINFLKNIVKHIFFYRFIFISQHSLLSARYTWSNTWFSNFFKPNNMICSTLQNKCLCFGDELFSGGESLSSEFLWK